jgi:hypothetical protein
VHQETGQRYPVGEDVVIGRSSGDIVFGDDPKLSSQHCRILRTPQGLGVHDLGSSNGTYVDGIKLHPEKVYVFKAGSLLTAGEQAFKLQEANVARKTPARKKRRPKRKQQSWDSFSIMAGIGLIAAALFFTHIFLGAKKQEPETKIEMLSPFQLVEKEMKAAFADYKELGRAKEAGELSDKGLANNIRKFLMPRLTAVHEKLGVIKPSGEYERRKLAADKKLVMALLEQVGAMAFYAETKSPKYGKDVERLTALATAAAEEAQKLENAREPSNFNR